MNRWVQRLAGPKSGAASVEFAIVLPAFATLVVGGVFAAQMMYAASSLRYAAEAAARCASLNATACGTTGATQTYALGKYFGPASPAPTFVATSTGCGHTVTGSISYSFDTGLKTLSVPISASACFP